ADQHDEGRNAPRQAQALQPVAQRIEKKGDGAAGGKGQQDGTQQPQHETAEKYSDEPEKRALPALVHGAFSAPARLRAQRTRYAEPDATVVAATARTSAPPNP